MTTVGIIFLVLQLGLMIYLGYRVFIKKAVTSKKDLIFVAPTFVLIYVLYLVSAIATDVTVDVYFLVKLIKSSFDTIAFDPNLDLIYPMVEAFPIFNAVFVLTCILSLITIVFGFIVLFGKRVANVYKKRRIFSDSGDIVIGYSEDSVKYLKANPNTVMWAEGLDSKTYGDLLNEGFAISREKLDSAKMLKILSEKEHHLIVFKDTDYSVSNIITFFERLKEGKSNLLYLHIETSVNEMRIIKHKYLNEVTENTNSFVTSFSKHELMARKFVTDYPITKFIPRSFYNENFTLKTEKEINVAFIGFGKVNYEMFKAFSVQFQFAKQGKNNELVSSPVHYYVLDKEAERLENEYFVKLLNGYEKSDCYFTAPDPVCDLKKPFDLYANSADAYKMLKGLVNKDTFTYFVISLAGDFEDASYALNLKESLGPSDNYKIFVRAKKNDNKQLNKSDDSIVYFGEDRESFARESIINEEIMRLSQAVNNIYNDTGYDRLTSIRKWESLPVIEQYSNISNAVNLSFKLNLLGFDIAREGESVSMDIFSSKYGKDLKDNKYKDYKLFFDTKPYNVLAFIEHSRWNAYYILSGFKQLYPKEFWWDKKEDKSGERPYLLELSHKKVEERKHACLTTYYGLNDLIKEKKKIIDKAVDEGNIYVKPKEIIEIANIYRYDYMVLDNLYQALQASGYSIINKKD